MGYNGPRSRRKCTRYADAQPEGQKALGVDNGAYVLLVNEKHSYYIQQVELQDAQGVRLWEWHPPRL